MFILATFLPVVSVPYFPGAFVGRNYKTTPEIILGRPSHNINSIMQWCRGCFFALPGSSAGCPVNWIPAGFGFINQP
jgi:hypothetical protein